MFGTARKIRGYGIRSTGKEQARIMGPAAFVIAIMGCADGGSACTPIETLPAQYSSEAACAAAAPAILNRGLDYEYPTILAQCQANTPAKVAGQSRTARVTDTGRSG
jgi:hypothetical protein